MHPVYGGLSLKDVAHVVIENMRKRKFRVALTTANVFMGVALLSSMMMLNNLYAVQAVRIAFIPLNLSEYQIWVLTISLVICITAILNSMLIAVVERYKEIGIIKCLGAKNSFIILLFIMESIFIGLIGGALGFAASLIATSILMLIQAGTLISLQSYLSIFLTSMLTAILISFIATILPAYYASRINPVEALRFEV